MTQTQDLSWQEALDLLATLDPHFHQLLAEFAAGIAALEQLSPRLSALCAIGTAAAFEAEAQLKESLREASTAGVTPKEALETIFQTMSFTGFRALARGLRTFVAVFGLDAVQGERVEEYPGGVAVDGYDAAALAVGVEMYGPVRARMNIDNFRAVGREFGDLLERFAYAGVFRRRVLPPLEREIVAVAMLATLEKPGPFTWHAKVALRLGATPDQLKYAVVKQIPISGVLRSLAALRLLAEIVNDWRAHPASDHA